jgi:hypothetical protein
VIRTPALLLAVLVASCAKPRGNATVSRNAPDGDCARCNLREAEEWRESLHRASFVSADFQRSYGLEHRAYCVACHSREPAGDHGIGCMSCHVRPHERHQEVATVACASCHDFDAPGTRAILQSTEREHRESAFATTRCEECHMPGHDHRFRVSRDPAMLGRALRVSSARLEGRQVVVELASSGVGHRFPTGDIFRRLTVTLTAFAPNGGVIGGDTFHLSRDFRAHRASLAAGQPEPLEDSRLGTTPRELRIACAGAPARVHLAVDYERGLSADDEFFAAFESLSIFDADLEVITRK